MAWAYFDTSALVKRYVDETGRRDVSRLLRLYAVVTSAMTPVELRSAFRRRVADGTIDERRLPGILEQLTADRGSWALVDASREPLAMAETLAATYPLRALDAIHVASAQFFARRIGVSSLLFVTADARQAVAAAASGMTPRRIAV